MGGVAVGVTRLLHCFFARGRLLCSSHTVSPLLGFVPILPGLRYLYLRVAQAHNIDNVCIDALSVAIRGDTLTRSLRNLATLNARVGSIKTTNADRLADEYARLVQGMSIQGILPANQDDVGRRRNAVDVVQASVVMLGVPFQYSESRVLRARLEYMRDNCGIREGDFLSFDALRQASQCLGRVVRSKADYGIMVLTDKRYVRADKRNKLPQRILELMPEANVDLDTDAAVSVSKAFLRAMAQPLDQSAQLGTALLSEADVRRLAEKDKVRTAALAEQRQNAKPVADAAPEPVQMQMDDDDDLADYLDTVAPDYDDEEMQVLEETEAQLRDS